MKAAPSTDKLELVCHVCTNHGSSQENMKTILRTLDPKGSNISLPSFSLLIICACMEDNDGLVTVDDGMGASEAQDVLSEASSSSDTGSDDEQ